jgi:hypothetical protein
VSRPEEARLRFWRNTTVLATGRHKTARGILGYEWDVFSDDCGRPPGLVGLSTTTKTIHRQLLQDFGAQYNGSGAATHRLTFYRHVASGALVFGAGTVQWAWALSRWHDAESGVSVPPDAALQQASVNILADMGVHPTTPCSPIFAQSPSSDSEPPESTISHIGSVGAGVGAGAGAGAGARAGARAGASGYGTSRSGTKSSSATRCASLCRAGAFTPTSTPSPSARQLTTAIRRTRGWASLRSTAIRSHTTPPPHIHTPHAHTNKARCIVQLKGMRGLRHRCGRGAGLSAAQASGGPIQTSCPHSPHQPHTHLTVAADTGQPAGFEGSHAAPRRRICWRSSFGTSSTPLWSDHRALSEVAFQAG